MLEYFSILEKILEWLDELRDNLRITRKNNLKDSKPIDFELDAVLIKIKAVSYTHLTLPTIYSV